MSEITNLHGYQPECILVQKIYDWVLVTQTFMQQVPLPTDCLAAVTAAIQSGEGVNATVSIESAVCEIISVTPTTAIVNGEELQVGLVVINKTVSARIQYFNAATGEALCNFVAGPYVFTERVCVCFTEGLSIDNISCDIVNVNGQLVTATPGSDGSVSLDIAICQEVQVEDFVRLEVYAKFCEPRPAEIINCNNFSCPGPAELKAAAPKQCPQIFPYHS